MRNIVSKEKHFLKYVIDARIRSTSPNRLNTRKTEHKFVAKTLKKCFVWNCFHICTTFLSPKYSTNKMR